MVQTTIMIKKSPAIGNDDAPVKISTLKKKKKKKRSTETTRREGEVDKEARFFEKKHERYKRQWPKCTLVSRFSRGGKLFLGSERLDIRAQISAVPSLSLSLCPVQKEATRMNRRRCLFRFISIPWREIEKKER